MVMMPAERIKKFERAYARLAAVDQAALSYPGFHSVGTGTKFTCRGLTALIEVKRIALELNFDNGVTDDLIIGHMRTMAQEQRRFAKIHAEGMLIDMPIKAMLDEKGLTTCYLLERIRDMKQHPDSPGQDSFHIDDISLTPIIKNGTITGAMSVSNDPFVQWDRGRVVVTDTQVPITLQEGYIGKKMREVVDHPWLEGLTIRRVHGKRDLHLAANEKAIPAGAHAVLDRL